MNVLELYSGIGGMHMALKETNNIEAEIVAAIDINTNANTVYKHNFPKTNLLNKNIQGLTAQYLNKMNIDLILMSPPCQPFTRNGLQKDILDPRTASFVHLLNLLPELPTLKYILMENVKGFEKSEMRDLFIKTLEENNFIFQEFLLSPTQFSVPNSRSRYYCLVKRKPLEFCFPNSELMESFPIIENKSQESIKISDFIENCTEMKEYLIPENILLKHYKVLDICTESSTNSCCFTKAYGRYIEGTGSVFTSKTKEDIDEIYKNINDQIPNSNQPDEILECLKKLELRFFTPKEVSRLMSFPDYFNFPDNLSRIQKYKLLGNSINVKVVSELIKLLLR